ncbi:hypothetical protein BOTNAR_0397g00140 [Botryotinia narcissicola]|uniref:Uncharacterized protein n=1 Tax=Botryotinia narcissicola TaxID=278944 RepID=A0A4Z1I0B9_9HELO|nr:hypothetical protein BOTNAR_0397g00140 [Botryotinia narcissicola]
MPVMIEYVVVNVIDIVDVLDVLDVVNKPKTAMDIVKILARALAMPAIPMNHSPESHAHPVSDRPQK